jgi:hypothetical protein
LNFEFALERFRLTDLAVAFYEKLMNVEDKEGFVGGFEEILSRETAGISKSLNDFYPRPDPAIVQSTDQMQSSGGMMVAFKGILEAFKAHLALSLRRAARRWRDGSRSQLQNISSFVALKLLPDELAGAPGRSLFVGGALPKSAG